MRHAVGVCLIVLLLPVGTATAETVLLTGDTLVATFSTNPPFMQYDSSGTAYPVAPDYLTWIFYSSPTPSLDFSYSARVYDGQTLLGTYSGSADVNSAGQLGYFKSAPPADSLAYWDRYYAPTVIDFSSILDGSIVGRLELEVTAGQLSYADSPYDRLVLWNVLSDTEAVGRDEWISTSSVTVQPVPEPASLLLLGTGLAGLVATIRRRRP